MDGETSKVPTEVQTDLTNWKQRFEEMGGRVLDATLSLASTVQKVSGKSADLAVREASVVLSRARRATLGRMRSRSCSIIGEEFMANRKTLGGSDLAVISSEAAEAIVRVEEIDRERVELDSRIDGLRHQSSD